MTINWQLLMPELIIILTFILVVIFDLFNSLQKTLTAWITIVGCAIALYVSIDMLQVGIEGTEFSNMIQVDKYSLFFQCHIFGLNDSGSPYLNELFGTAR